MPFEIITTVRPTAQTTAHDSFTAISTRRTYRFGMKKVKNELRTFLREQSWPKAVRDEVADYRKALAKQGRPVETSDFIVFVSPSSAPVHEGQTGLSFDIHFVGPKGQLSPPRQVPMDGRITSLKVD